MLSLGIYYFLFHNLTNIQRDHLQSLCILLFELSLANKHGLIAIKSKIQMSLLTRMGRYKMLLCVENVT